MAGILCDDCDLVLKQWTASFVVAIVVIDNTPIVPLSTAETVTGDEGHDDGVALGVFERVCAYHARILGDGTVGSFFRYLI